MRVTVYSNGVIEFKLNEHICFVEKVVYHFIKPGDYLIEDILTPSKIRELDINEQKKYTMFNFGWAAKCIHDTEMAAPSFFLSPAGFLNKKLGNMTIPFKNRNNLIRIYNLFRDIMEQVGYIRLTVTKDKYNKGSVINKCIKTISSCILRKD